MAGKSSYGLFQPNCEHYARKAPDHLAARRGLTTPRSRRGTRQGTGSFLAHATVMIRDTTTQKLPYHYVCSNFTHHRRSMATLAALHRTTTAGRPLRIESRRACAEGSGFHYTDGLLPHYCVSSALHRAGCRTAVAWNDGRRATCRTHPQLVAACSSRCILSL